MVTSGNRIFVWIYYAGMLLLFGAELTEQYARARGHEIRPSGDAVSTGAVEQA